MNIKTINIIQNFFLGVSLIILSTIPLITAYFPEIINPYKSALYKTALLIAAVVMILRPLANLIPHRTFAQLVILRKGLGVLSASIVVSFTIADILINGYAYFTNIISTNYWSISNYLILARLGEWSAVILLLTSNNFSKRILKANWKRIQKLAYVYFYAGALYEMSLEHISAFILFIVVTFFVIAAFIKNRLK